MKKFTSCFVSLLALCTPFTGLAQDQSVKNAGSGAFANVRPTIELPVIEKPAFAQNSPTKPKMKKNVKTADFVGNFVWFGRNTLYTIVDPNGGCLSIVENPDVAGQVLIYGFVNSNNPLNGYVLNDRLYIPNQKVGFSDYYNEDVWFWNISLRNPVTAYGEDPNTYYYENHPSVNFFFTLGEDGYLYAGDSYDINEEKWYSNGFTNAELQNIVCVASLVLYDNFESYWLRCQWIYGCPLEQYFVYDESLWENIGEVSFKDAWFPNLWPNGKTPEYKVPIYRYKSNHNQFLLMNPYGPETPYGENGYMINNGRTGMIGFDISDPEHVMFYPTLYGCTRQSDNNPYYLYDSTGYYYYIEGLTIDDMKDWTYLFPSTLSKNTGVIAINDASFSYINNGVMFNNREWTNFDMNGYIILPSNYNAAVDEILADEADSPAEYYNLQGVKVANPDKGTIVIKRQGSKTTKIIF